MGFQEVCSLTHFADIGAPQADDSSDSAAADNIDSANLPADDSFDSASPHVVSSSGWTRLLPDDNSAFPQH